MKQFVNGIINSPNNILYKVIMVLSSIFILSGFVVFKFSIVDLLIYGGFNLFYVLLPGYFIFKLLKIKTINKISEKIVYSFIFGIIFTIASYFTCYISGLKIGLYMLGPVLSLSVLLRWIKERKYMDIKLLKAFDYKVGAIAFILLAVSFAGVSLRNLTPDIVGISTINQDLVWNLGNLESLQKSFPVMDIRFDGLNFKYHYFAFIFRVVASFVTQISNEKIFFVYSQFTMIPLLIMSLYVLAQTIFNDTKKSRFFIWVFFFTGCATLEQFMLNVTINNLIIVPNGIDLAVPTLLILADFLIKIYRENNVRTGELMAVAMLTALLTGAKGTFGVMIVGTVFVMFMISLIKKEFVVINFKFLFATLVSFCGIYWFILAQGGDSIKLIPGGTVISTPLTLKIINSLTVESSNLLRYGIANIFTPIHFILFLPFVAAPFIFWFVDTIKKGKGIKQEEFLIGGLAISGTVGFYIFSVEGMSQLYFIFGAPAFIEICGLVWIYGNYNKLRLLTKRLIIATFIISSISSFSMIALNSALGMRVAYLSVRNIKSESEPIYNGITRYEYEGMLWLKENVKDEEIVAVDRQYYTKPDPEHIPAPNDNSRYFYYSAYSGKQIFLEGWAYTPRTAKMREAIVERFEINQSLYDEKNDNRVNLMKENNITYIVVSRFSNEGLTFSEPNLKEVFNNRDIRIYKLVDDLVK